jgi:8-oxo-dGTP pyrophosphatase MutT (NUDIX family)
MARQERSAGFIVYFRPPSPRPLEFLLLDYGRHWDFPKGHVEDGEDDLTTAKRELAEETGLAAEQIHPQFQHEMTYFFRNKRHGLVRKTVVYFLAEVGTNDVKISHEHEGFEFLPYEQAIARLTFPSAKQILRLAWEQIKEKPA